MAARVLVTAPQELPVDLAELKAQLRLGDDETAEHYLLYSYLRTAIEMAENFTGRALISRTYDLFFDEFPAEILLTRPPAQSVTSITYTDIDGVSQTLSSAIYQTDLNSTPARIKPAYGQFWPSTRMEMNAVAVRYVAGYGDDPDAVPESLRHAINLMASTWWENRTDLLPAQMPDIPVGSRYLMMPYITLHG